MEGHLLDWCALVGVLSCVCVCGGVSLDHGFVILESPSKILFPSSWVPGFGDPAAGMEFQDPRSRGLPGFEGWGGIQVLEYQIGAPN